MDLAQEDERIVILSPKVNIQTMLKEYGYPFKSKEHSNKLSIYQHSGIAAKTVKRYLGLDEYKGASFQCPKCLRYQFSPDFDIKVSDKCCHKLKKEPAKRWAKENGKTISILGLRMAEGGQRANKTGCIIFDKDRNLIKFKPLNPVSDEFIEWYKDTHNIKLCRLYYEPFNLKRTGCKGCPFSPKLQEQLDMMEKCLPIEKAQCEFIWKPIYEEYRRIGYRLRKDGGEKSNS